LPKITILRWFFPSKLISNCCSFSMDWDRVKCFSAFVTRYLMINLGSFLAFHKSKLFLAMRGTTAPLQPPKQKGGTSPFWQPPDVSFGWGAEPKKWSLLLTTFLKKTSVRVLNKAFFHHLRQQ
jgi:hypothetical protein